MVKYLMWHMNKTCKYCVARVKLEEQINKYKTKNPNKTPVIIFDYLSCLRLFLSNDAELLCAGRQTECTRKITLLCKRLKELGCELVFFVDGPLQDEKLSAWLTRVNDKYEDHKQIFQLIKNNTPLCKIKNHQILTSYSNNCFRIMQEYGKIIICLSNECDIELAHYATINRVAGVFTYDSDFLIMPGDWAVWSPNHFDWNDFSTILLIKRKLRNSLKLEQKQMPIFATLAGNDFMRYEIIEPFLDEITGKEKGFSKLSNYIRQEYPDGYMSFEQSRKLAKIIYSYHKDKQNPPVQDEENVRRLLLTSLNFYNYKKIIKHELQPNWLKKHINDTQDIIVYCFLKEKTFIIRQNFIDLSKNDVQPYSELVLPLVRRLMGIILYDERDKQVVRRIMLKPSHNESFKIHFIQPIYPTNFEIPNLIDLLGYGKITVSDEKKFEILTWVVSCGRRKLKVSDLIEISNSIYFIPALILNYLYKNMQITCEEADVMLLAIHEALIASEDKMKNLSPPITLQERPFWFAFVYTQINYIFLSSLIVCGLRKYLKQSYFDGYIFHKMYPKYLSMKIDERKTLLEPIQKYRLYTK